MTSTDITNSTTPSPVDLATTTLAHITIHPEQHNQGTWWDDSATCGFVGCYAGWMAHLDPLVETHTHGAVLYDGHWVGYSTYVADRLGMRPQDVTALTYANNTLDDLEAGIIEAAVYASRDRRYGLA